MKTIKKSVSILLAVIMVFSLFTIVPFSASAAINQVTWSYDDMRNSGKGSYTKDGVTLTPSNDEAHFCEDFYINGTNTFTAPGSVFTKIEIICGSVYDKISGWTKEACRYQPYPDVPDYWRNGYKLTWTGNAESVEIRANASSISSIVFTLSPADVANVASVTSNGTTTKYTDFAQALNAWAPASVANGSTLKLLADVSYNPVISVYGTKTLDLNGHGITGTGTIAIASGGNVTLTDSDPTAVHYFDVQNGYAVNINNTSGEKSFTGGYLAGGTGDWGSAIQISGTLTMDGGTILGNTSNYSGAVRVHNNATFTMTGGQIIYNRCAAREEGNNASLNAESEATINFSGNPVIKNNVNPSGKPANAMVRQNLTKKLNVIGTLTDGAEIGITMQDNNGRDYTGAFTASSDISFNDQTKFFSDKSSYTVGKNADGQLILGVPHTVTWKDDEGNTIDTTTVADGGVPTHDDPTKPDDENYTYTFAGWSDGTNFYLPNALPRVTGDITFTAIFDAVSTKLIVGHSLTLDGDIGINFCIDPSVAGMTAEDVNSGNFSYSFAWADGNALVDVEKQAQSQAFTVENGLIKVTCKVCAAEMSCGVNASFTLGDKSDSEVYSVRKYCDTILDRTSKDSERIIARDGEEKYSQLVDLVKKMLDYGAKAQTTFGIKTDDLANSIVSGYNMQNVTDKMFTDAIQPAEGTDISANNIAADTPAGAAFKAPSLVFLTKNTLRLYFEKTGDSFNTSGLTKWNDYYYAQVTNIAAAELDTLQVFSVSGKTLYYSAFDYAKLLLNTSNADIAKALYWYNQAANVFFA